MINNGWYATKPNQIKSYLNTDNLYTVIYFKVTIST